MESTLNVAKKHHLKTSESFGGEYRKAAKQFEKAINSKDIEGELKKIYLKYQDQLDDISDDFHELIMICRAFCS